MVPESNREPGEQQQELDLAPDGKRIAALMPVETSEDPGAQNHVTFLLNFLDELERRVPAGK